MFNCGEESFTHHYLGRWFGFGPARDTERVIYAVFQKAPRNGNLLNENSFENNKLKKNSQSLARASWVTRRQFDRKIVRRDTSSNGPMVGIAYADVAKVRALRVDVKLNTGTKNVRAICVLDRVESGDCAGHATMGYEWAGQLNLSQAQVATIRKKIRYDLANTFSEVIEPSAQQWPRIWDLVFGRALSIARVLRETGLRR